MRIAFELAVTPRPWKRPRAVALPGMKGVRMFSDADQERHFRDVIALAAPFAPAVPLEGPLSVVLAFRLPAPAGWPGWKRAAALTGAVRPVGPRSDLDNLMKGVLDALGRSGRWWRDDGQVVEARISKTYGAAPGTLVEIEELPHVTSAAEWRRAVNAPRVRPEMVAPGEDDPRTERPPLAR